MRPRSNDPRYLACVRELFGKIGEQARGLLWKDGGPIVGVQIENEYWCENPDAPGVGYDHMRELKRLAVEAGLTAPLYTATAWGNATVVEGETLPVESGYVDAPWDQHTDELPESPHFMMQTVRDDPLVGRDLKKDSAAAPGHLRQGAGDRRGRGIHRRALPHGGAWRRNAADRPPARRGLPARHGGAGLLQARLRREPARLLYVPRRHKSGRQALHPAGVARNRLPERPARQELRLRSPARRVRPRERELQPPAPAAAVRAGVGRAARALGGRDSAGQLPRSRRP